jgi:hypothetical protein
MPDIRIITCPDCLGDGGWEILTGMDDRNGEPRGYWRGCEACEGCGEIEVEVEVVTAEDLDDGPPHTG